MDGHLPKENVEKNNEKINRRDKIDQKIEAYQSGNVFDFDDSIILHYYPKRIYQMLCLENGSFLLYG